MILDSQTITDTALKTLTCELGNHPQLKELTLWFLEYLSLSEMEEEINSFYMKSKSLRRIKVKIGDSLGEMLSFTRLKK